LGFLDNDFVVPFESARPLYVGFLLAYHSHLVLLPKIANFLLPFHRLEVRNDIGGREAERFLTKCFDILLAELESLK
jgi:hypothetical protein